MKESRTFIAVCAVGEGSGMEIFMDTRKDFIEKYKGNYIREMRRIVGHAPLLSIGCGVIIENEKGEILLQKRRDNGCWAILGGSVEFGEKIVETAKREVMEGGDRT